MKRPSPPKKVSNPVRDGASDDRNPCGLVQHSGALLFGASMVTACLFSSCASSSQSSLADSQQASGVSVLAISAYEGEGVPSFEEIRLPVESLAGDPVVDGGPDYLTSMLRALPWSGE